MFSKGKRVRTMSNELKVRNKYDDINELVFSRSNILIESKHNCSLLENKLIAYGLATFQVTSNDDIYSDIPISVFKQYEGIDKSNIYKYVKKVAETITKHTVIVEKDDSLENASAMAPTNTKRRRKTGKKEFLAFNLVNTVHYIEGEATFRIVFGRELKPLISNLSAPYTTTRITTLMSINNNYAYRLYELLSEKEYLLYPKSKKEGRDSVIIRYENLNELRMQLTLVNVDDEKTRRILTKPYKELNEEEKEVYEAILQKSLYKEWGDLKKRVIDVAKKSIDENILCPIRFDYKPIRTGLGGRVTGIEFEIRRNENYKYHQTAEHTVVENDDNMKNIMEQILEVRNFMKNEKLTDADIEMFLECANYDIELIKANYELSLKQDFISNFVGWMKRAIQNNWAENENIQVLKDRSPEETDIIKDMYEDYINEKIDIYEADGNQLSMKFGDEPIPEPKVEKMKIDDHFIDLFMKYTSGEELSEDEEKMMKKHLMKFALDNLKEE